MFKKYIGGYDKKEMLKKGYIYSKEIDKYEHPEYGYYLGGIMPSKKDKYYYCLTRLGYEVCFGPVVFESDIKVGLYCRNYSKDGIVKNDYDEGDFSQRLISLCELREDIKDEHYLFDLVECNISYLVGYTMKFSNDELYGIISFLDNYKDSINVICVDDLKIVINSLKNQLYERIVKEVDKNNNDLDIDSLANTAKYLAGNLCEIRQRPYFDKHRSEDSKQNMRAIVSFVKLVKENSSTSEIRGLLNKLEDGFGSYIDGSEYMTIILESYVKEKTIDEYFSLGKVKEKK